VLLLRLSLPDLTQQLTANSAPTSLFVRQNALRRAEDADAQAAKDAGNVLMANIDAPTGS
jgi:hypothetical protein